VSLLARDQAIVEEQLEKVMVGGGSNLESGGQADWEQGDGMANLLAFPQPEGPQVGAQQARPASTASLMPEEENGAWPLEAPGIYTMETVNDLAGAAHTESKAAEEQATHRLVVPPRLWQRMPKNVRRALLIFCIVGIVALLSDGILLALSLTRHHTVASMTPTPRLGIDQQVASPEPGSPLTSTPLQTPTGTAQNGTLVLSTQRLAFSATQGESALVAQTITLTGVRQGNAWRVEPLSASPVWLRLSAWQGNVGAGSTASFTVNVHPPDLAPGFYTASVLVKAFDAQGKALAGSPATLAIALNVHALCSLSVTPLKLSFASVLGSVPAPQTLTLSENSSCAFPVSWHASADVPWLSFTNASGMDSASGDTITVQASTSGKLIGSYPAYITLRGTDNAGAPLVVSPATISVTLTVIA
jgi:hypothetical protein